ncbi:MAG: hypothetical protein ACLUKN_13270 [Bacilli bacterium]
MKSYFCKAPVVEDYARAVDEVGLWNSERAMVSKYFNPTTPFWNWDAARKNFDKFGFGRIFEPYATDFLLPWWMRRGKLL